ncbi:hypothetical protein Q644_16285 [Brucella intermedia 229E]|uniref:Uncharacterized protein n=1 Tax=Brucella intermedia 229E TaxID=1337887 RepID=U4V934_9HYPH|nr:hypothetical protein Q644_16285 [Brucella intermedia 229E]
MGGVRGFANERRTPYGCTKNVPDRKPSVMHPEIGSDFQAHADMEGE